MRILSVGVLVPGTLALLAIVDVPARFVPLERLAFRPWEAAVERHSPDAPFRSRVSLDFPESHGDLASLGNLPGVSQSRRETFTTEETGFRGRGGLPPMAGPGDTMDFVCGDSFAAGSSLCDDETLSAQLERVTRRPVYNLGGIEGMSATRVLDLAERLGAHRGRVFQVFFERCDPPPGFYGSMEPTLLQRLRDTVPPSRVKILAERLQKRLHDGRFLPNHYARSVLVESLPGGEPMLFLPAESERKRRSAAGAGAYWAEYDAELRRHGFELFVVLVPTKIRVYGSLVVGGDAAWADRSPYLEETERLVRAAGVRALDLTPVFQRAAREGLARGELLYWRDDTHWTPRAVALAAESVAAELR
jgi:hypothetical protein